MATVDVPVVVDPEQIERVKRLMSAAGNVSQAAQLAMVLMRENGMADTDEYLALEAAIDAFSVEMARP